MLKRLELVGFKSFADKTVFDFGDGNIDFAVYRNGQWMIDTHRDGKANVTFAFGGVAGDRPLAGRWGSGGAVPMLFRDGTWLVSANRDGKVTAQVAFGGKGDVPLAVRPLR